MATRLKLHADRKPVMRPPSDTALAYDAVAAAYLDHAHGFTDRALWARLDALLVRMWTEGRRAIRILDLGCGPGTWLLRLALRARDLGFRAIDGRGVDLSPARIDLARSRMRLADDPHIGLRFDVGDLIEVLADEENRSFDIVLCLNGVLNHLAPHSRSLAVAEIERLCDGDLFVTAYSIGGSASVHLADACDVLQFHQDHQAGRLQIHLRDGRHLDLPSHLFTAAELAGLNAG